MNRVKLPSTNSQIVNGAKLDFLMAYPPQALILNLDQVSTSTLTIGTEPNRNGEDDYVIAINNVLYENIYTGTASTVALTSTGLGGLIDGITFVAANARDFLIWGIANNANTAFSGFAATHKPYSTYTSPATVNKGVEYTFTGLTNAFQFTLGARVCVRNSVTATGFPQDLQWNWGTITEIVSNTSIKILMDSNTAYGVNLTSTTGANIIQWNMFRPWVVGSSQSLYSNNYRLLGELYTDASGNITATHRVDDPWRSIGFNLVYSNNTASLPSYSFSFSQGRVIPLWANRIDALMAITCSTTANNFFSMLGITASGLTNGISYRNIVANLEQRENGNVHLGSYAILRMTANTSVNTLFQGYISNYYVPGGMHL